jgi:hypothetical protein
LWRRGATVETKSFVCGDPTERAIAAGTVTGAGADGAERPEAIGNAGTRQSFGYVDRTLVSEKLSKIADVMITERTDGKVHGQLIGKYIGPPQT